MATDELRPAPILCADDYGMTAGVSAGIEELASAGRLSAVSALVTRPNWPEFARRLEQLRSQAAIGLHFNLTLGEPLGPMPNLAPTGRFPAVGKLLKLALLGRIDEAEVASEIGRQLDLFEQFVGHPPDMIDGHQHVHAFPQIRRALLRTLRERYPTIKPMIRDPADSPMAIAVRGVAVPKALMIAAVAAGFGRSARRLGFPTNRGFSGFSRFDAQVPDGRELQRFFIRPGPDHLIMCHPGYPDEELARIDPVVDRRKAELEVLRSHPELPSLIRHPHRDEAGRIRWGMVNG